MKREQLDSPFTPLCSPKDTKNDCPLWTFAIFGDIIKSHVNMYIFNVKSKEEQENGKKNEDHGR